MTFGWNDGAIGNGRNGGVGIAIGRQCRNGPAAIVDGDGIGGDILQVEIFILCRIKGGSVSAQPEFTDHESG